jgi:hypothetical protein
MADDPFYAPFRKPDPPREAQPGEPVWTLSNGERRLSCELSDHGDDGCEARLFRDGDFYKGRRLATRAAALAHVAAARERLERDGWTLVTPERPQPPSTRTDAR